MRPAGPPATGQAFPDLDARRLARRCAGCCGPAGWWPSPRRGVRLALGVHAAPAAQLRDRQRHQAVHGGAGLSAGGARRLDLDLPLARQLSRFRGYPPHITRPRPVDAHGGLAAAIRCGLRSAPCATFTIRMAASALPTVLASGRRWSWLGRDQAGRLRIPTSATACWPWPWQRRRVEAYPAALRALGSGAAAPVHTGFAPLHAAARHTACWAAAGQRLRRPDRGGGLYSTADDLLSFARSAPGGTAERLGQA